MADNVAITAGSGTTIATDDVGGVQFQRVKVAHGADGTGTDANATTPLPVNDYARAAIAAASAMTRPANTTPYTANDAVSNNATAGSVTAISVTLADINDAPLLLLRCRIDSTDTGVAGKSFRVWLFNADPTSSSGVVGGDNAAFSTKRGSFIGAMVGTFYTFSDGSIATCAPEWGQYIATTPTSGAKTIYALLQTIDAFTPSANSTTFTLTLEAIQCRS